MCSGPAVIGVGCCGVPACIVSFTFFVLFMYIYIKLAKHLRLLKLSKFHLRNYN